MRIVWDEPKRRATLAKRGLDFAILSPEFFIAAKIEVAKAGRYRAFGFIGERAYAVIFTKLGAEAISIVSLRPASTKERREL